MKIILIGGGETIETVYYLARLFEQRAYQVTVIDDSPEEARDLARRVKATVLVGDGSDPVLLEEAGARRADVLLSLTGHDPDNLVACQMAKRLFGVPRTMALVNDPDNEGVFAKLGIDLVFSATRIIGSLIEGQTVFDEIVHLFPAAEGKLNVTEVVLRATAPVAGMSLQEIELPPDSLVASIIRDGQVTVPRGDSELRAADRLILITLPENQEQVMNILTGPEKQGRKRTEPPKT
jgi:trk system potassium uptake protein TrkA